MIFVDTGGWVGYVSPDDDYHLQANNWMRGNRQILVTTDYILDESLTLLKARGELVRAEQLGSLLFGDMREISSASTITTPSISSTIRGSARGQGATTFRLYHLTEEDVQTAWHVFRQYKDKEWSFTGLKSQPFPAVLQRAIRLKNFC